MVSAAETQAYVQAATAGYGLRLPVRVAASEYVLLFGRQTVYGVGLEPGDRMLAMAGDLPWQRGIFVVSEGAWSRASDSATGEQIARMMTFAREGLVNRQTAWVLETNGEIIPDVTPLSFVPLVPTTGPAGPQGIRGVDGAIGPPGPVYYVPHFVYFGAPSASALFAKPVLTESVLFQTGLPGARAVADFAATADTVFSIQQNTTQRGTCTFAAGQTVGTFSWTADITFTSGEVLRIVAPASPDATLADISITLRGLRV